MEEDHQRLLGTEIYTERSKTEVEVIPQEETPRNIKEKKILMFSDVNRILN